MKKHKLMTRKIRILKFDNYADVRKEFELIGVDSAGMDLMIPKAFQLNIRVSELSSPAAFVA